jgi:hypothetical protein
MALSKKRQKTFNATSEELSFVLNGEEFKCYSDLDYRVYTETVASLANKDENTDMINVFLTHLNEFIVPEDRGRFNDMINDDDTIIPAKLIGDCWRWLLESYGILEPESNDSKRK